MAIYVTINKISEDEIFALYAFGPDEIRVGQIRIHKKSGGIEVLSEVPEDEKQTYSLCATRKLHLHWRNNEFPKKTCFAA